MDSPQIIRNFEKLAKEIGAPLSSRSCSGNHLWDGKTLATNYNEWKDKDGVYPPELETKNKPIPVKDLCHELGHWSVCEPSFRDLPEYGLGVLGLDFGANGGYHLNPSNVVLEGLFSTHIADRYEAKAQLLGLIYCYKIGANPGDMNYWIPSYSKGSIREWVKESVSNSFGISLKKIETILSFFNPTSSQEYWRKEEFDSK